MPWFRQRWPWLLIAGPAIVVAAALYTAWLAVSTDDGVIADDYYRRGLVINREIERTSRGAAMQMGAVLRVAPDGAATLELRGVYDAPPPAVRVLVVHPTRGGHDITATLTRGPGGTYVGTIAPRPEGRWLVAVEAEAWRLPAEPVADGLREVRLGTASGRATNEDGGRRQ